MVCNISLVLLLPGHCTKLGETEWSAEPSHQSLTSATSSQKQRENADSESSSLAASLPVQEMHKGHAQTIEFYCTEAAVNEGPVTLPISNSG